MMWNLLPSEDESMIADAARAFLSAELPLDRLRPRPAAIVDQHSMREAMGRLGWFAIGLADEDGGELIAELLLQRELGRCLASPATLGLVIAGHVLAEAGEADEARRIASGSASIGVGMLGDNHRAMVFDWREGERIVAWSGDGIGLFAGEVFRDAEQRPCLDDSLTLHVGRLPQDGALVWLPADRARLGLRTRALIAARLCGLAEQACDLTVDYVKLREQFGAKIGSFQAVKHRCADMAVRARLAWRQLCVAGLAIASGSDDVALQTDSALLLAADAAHENGRAGIQLHGAIGFQAECDIHWFAKRAHVYDQLSGGRFAAARRVVDHAA